MKNTEQYTQFALCREMQETPDVIRQFAASQAAAYVPLTQRVLLSGEGSSRIFPAKRLIAQILREGQPLQVYTEAATQAQEYNLQGWHVFVASNSGKTAEGVRLIQHLRGKAATTGIVAYAGTPIAVQADNNFVLGLRCRNSSCSHQVGYRAGIVLRLCVSCLETEAISGSACVSGCCKGSSLCFGAAGYCTASSGSVHTVFFWAKQRCGGGAYPQNKRDYS